MGELRSTAAIVAVLLFFTYAYFLSAPHWNENSRFDLTRSLVERQRLDIDPYHHNTGDKSERGGHFYSDKAPGASFLATPIYAAYYGYLRLTGAENPSSRPAPDPDDVMVNGTFRRSIYLCNLFTNALAGALLGAGFFWMLVTRLSVPRAQALVATAALGVGSIVLPYATLFFGHVLAAAFLFGAFAAVPARRPGLAGALAGLAVLTEFPTAVPAVALAVYAAVVERRRAIRFAAGAALPLLLLVAYQAAAFGSPFSPGYAHVSDPRFSEGMSRGIMGVGWPRPDVLAAILVGRGRGLLYLCPVLVLGFIGLVRSRAYFAGGIVAYFLLFNAGYYMWDGGAATGPRHLIPALPFLALGIPFAFRTWWFALPLLALSTANVLAATALAPTMRRLDDVLLQFIYPSIADGQVALAVGSTNLGLLIGLPGLWSLVPLLGVWALGVRILMAR